MVTIVYLIIVTQTPSEFQISAWNRAQTYIEDSNYRLSFRDLFLFDITHTNYRLGGRFVLNESIRFDTILGERLAQRFFEYERDYLSIHVGNFYETFGQGMVLNTFEDEAVRVDWNIDGINGQLHSDRLILSALVGRPRADNENRKEVISGGELLVRPFPAYELGLAYLRFDATNTPKDSSFGLPVEERASLGQKLSLGPVQFVAELGHRDTWGRFDPNAGWIGTKNVNGYGLYGALNLGLSGLGILAEYKNYSQFDGRYSAPPPCSQTGKSLNRSNDEQGYRFLVELSPLDYLTLSTGYNRARSRTGLQRLGEWSIGLRTDAGFAIITPTYLQTREKAVESAYPRKNEHNLGLDLIIGAVTIGGEYKFISDSLLNDAARTYANQKLTLGYTWNWLSVSGQVETTNKPPDALEKDNRWASVSVKLRFSNHNLSVSYGSYRGQLECSTGICRYEPPFRGIKVELESRF